MATELRRKTPEEFLRECQIEEAAIGKGHLKIFLGYASGVGKSFRMLDEARRRERSQNVVIGAMQPRVPPEVQHLLAKLEVIPLKEIGGGTAIDVDAIIRRNTRVCFIDGLAYNNPTGAQNSTRWEDVRDIIDAGIKVIASVNVQYVEELAPQIEGITGKHITETIPMAFIKGADEIEIVDAPPDRVDHRLGRLRELALLLAADVVDCQLNDYLERNGIHQHFGTHERILVCLTPRANLNEMLEEAQATARGFHGEVLVAYVRQDGLSDADQSLLDTRLAIANAAGIRIIMLEGSDPAQALLDYARSHGVTQLFVGHSQRTGLARLRGSPLDKLISEGHGMDVLIFPQ